MVIGKWPEDASVLKNLRFFSLSNKSFPLLLDDTNPD